MQQGESLVTGVTGGIGSRITRGLLDAGHHVNVIGRNPERLKALADLGATVLQGDVRDAGFVERSFAGANAALLVAAEDSSPGHVAANFGHQVRALRDKHDLLRGGHSSDRVTAVKRVA